MFVYKTKIINSSDGRQYRLVFSKHHDDYVYYVRYYLSKNGRGYGNWKGLGWYTNISHALRALKKRLKGCLLTVIG